MWSFLKPEPHRPLLSKEKIDPTYKRLRWQVFIGIFIGYAGYYLVRKNFSLAMPYLVDMGFDKGLLGVAISANAIAYGLSKFIMGGVSDRSSARKFLPLGLTLSALATLLLGTKVGVSSIVSMFILQFLIGWFQGMGWPPCGRGNSLRHTGAVHRPRPHSAPAAWRVICPARRGFADASAHRRCV